MKIEFDPVKRQAALEDRGLDFADVWQVFDSPFFTQADNRFDYPEERFQTYGLMDGRLIMFAWIPIHGGMRVISMRKCNERERKSYNARMG
jgi:uncharacterized protein